MPVALIRNDKTTFSESATDAKGVARICDAPLEYLDVVVGRDICGSILVRHLKPTWPETRRLYVTYVDAPCDHFVVAPNCRVLLRIQDSSGRPVVGARFEETPPNRSGTDVSDVFGRLFRSLKRGEQLEGVVVKTGSEPARVSMRCMDDVELKVVLHSQ